MTLPDWTRRPAQDELGERTRGYVALVPDGDLLRTLEQSGRDFVARLRALPAERERHRYAPGKWTVREVVGHCIDAERVITLRTLWIARGAEAPQPGWEEEDWARASNAGERSLAELADEWETLRASTLQLLRSLDAVALDRRGVANRGSFTARGMAWVCAGHALHHRAILEERYLG